MSKEAEKFIEKYTTKDQNDWLVEKKDIIAKFMESYHTEQLTLTDVVSSAWYCKISTINRQWFEIVTGKNEMEVAVKITEKFGKQTVYNLIDRYELM